MKRMVPCVLSFLTMIAIVVLAAPLAIAADPIPVGIAVAQTSNVALFGQEQIIGAQIAEEFFNQKGGVNGRPIKLVLQDTAGDEAGAINAFQNLINVAKVVAIVGTDPVPAGLRRRPHRQQGRGAGRGPLEHGAGHPPDRRIHLARVGPGHADRPERGEGSDGDEPGPQAGRGPLRAERRVQQVGDAGLPGDGEGEPQARARRHSRPSRPPTPTSPRRRPTSSPPSPTSSSSPGWPPTAATW